jgi:hypothetical protein
MDGILLIRPQDRGEVKPHEMNTERSQAPPNQESTEYVEVPDQGIFLE